MHKFFFVKYQNSGGSKVILPDDRSIFTMRRGFRNIIKTTISEKKKNIMIALKCSTSSSHFESTNGNPSNELVKNTPMEIHLKKDSEWKIEILSKVLQYIWFV